MASECVKVIVRCRPMNQREFDLECNTSIGMDGSCAQVTLNNPRDTKAPPKHFTFDGAYFIDSTTENIYNEIAYPLVEGVTEGYNGTIFAYGQTGCGKSFTMQGITDPLTQRGIIPRAFDHVFETVSCAESTKFLIHASYCEIYNEDIRDLLGKDTKAKLELHEHPERGVYVNGLSPHPVHNVVECEKIMDKGWKNRATGETLMNLTSSRSHSIFTINLEMMTPDEDGEEHIRAGKLNLVDLAGSERQAKTGSTGDRLKEATKINLSLSALGNVISALVDGKSKHIPYRDSKLTRLLQDSLGGNTKTLMVACVSPADNNYDESLSTLRYANRAKNIKNKPTINEDPKDALLRQYQEEIQKLKAMLMGQLPIPEGGFSDLASVGSSTSIMSDRNNEQARLELEHEKGRIREEYDSKLRNMQHQYEEEKVSKVKLQQDMAKLRSFYDEKLHSVDGQIESLPCTAEKRQTVGNMKMMAIRDFMDIIKTATESKLQPSVEPAGKVLGEVESSSEDVKTLAPASVESSEGDTKVKKKGGKTSSIAGVAAGSIIKTADGSTVVKNADGTIVKTTSGVPIIPEGAKIITNADGTTVIRNVDGTVVKTTSGVPIVPEGAKIIKNADGTTVIKNADGTIVKTTSGVPIVPEGAKIIKNADGTTVIKNADGTIVKTASGVPIVPEGGNIITNADGTIFIKNADGTIVKAPDGTVIPIGDGSTESSVEIRMVVENGITRTEYVEVDRYGYPLERPQSVAGEVLPLGPDPIRYYMNEAGEIYTDEDVEGGSTATLVPTQSTLAPAQSTIGPTQSTTEAPTGDQKMILVHGQPVRQDGHQLHQDITDDDALINPPHDIVMARDAELSSPMPGSAGSRRRRKKNDGSHAPASSPTHAPMKEQLNSQKEEAMKRLHELEQQMVGGENIHNMEVKDRRSKRKRFAEERKRNLADAISKMDDDGIMLQIYDNIGDELKAKNKKLLKAVEKNEALNVEILDIQSEFEFEKIDYLDTIRKQEKQLKLFYSLVEQIQPCVRRDCNYSNLDKIKMEAKWDEEEQKWILPKLTMEKTALPVGTILPGRMGGARSPRMNGEVDDYDDRFREKIMRKQDKSGQYFQTKRQSQLVTEPLSKVNMKEVKHSYGIQPVHSLPVSNGFPGQGTTGNDMSSDLKAAHVHGQVMNDEGVMRKPKRLEALQPIGKKSRKKNRNFDGM